MMSKSIKYLIYLCLSININLTFANIDKYQLYQVKKVIDGDTIEIMYDDKLRRVRLIGINAPETKKKNQAAEFYANEAKQYLQQLLALYSNKIILEFDEQLTDSYNRLLAYVYVNKYNKFVNEEMLKKGFATFVASQNKYAPQLKDAENYARSLSLGLWKQSPIISAFDINEQNYKGFNKIIKGTILDIKQTKKYTYFKLSNTLSFSISNNNANLFHRGKTLIIRGSVKKNQLKNFTTLNLPIYDLKQID